MKQLFCTLIGIFALVVTNALPSNAQQAFYIYRNDGAINTFITTEIDSMAYSCFDLDSVSHDEYVVHEVYTPDSIYRIPLALIDSIGFVTPETVYQPGVRVLEGEMRNYIISRDDLTLTFQSDTPTNLLPKIGDKLVTTEIDDVITNVFVGQVSEISTNNGGIQVVCSPVALTDVFECYYGIIKKSDEPMNIRTRGIFDGFYSTNGTRTFSPGTFSHNLFDANIQYEVVENLLTVYSEAKATISLTPTIDYNAYAIINKDYGINISVTAVGNYTIEELLSLSGNIQLGGDIKISEIVIPIPEALIDVFVEFGIFGTATATIVTDQTWTQKYKHVFHWEWSDKKRNMLNNTNELKPISNTHTSDVAIKGNLSIGAYVKTGIAFIATSNLDIAEIGYRIDLGGCLEGTYVPYNGDIEYANISTEFYNRIKDYTYPLSWFYGLSAYATLFKWSVSTTPQFPFIPTSKQGLIKETRAVPLFSDTNMEYYNNGGVYYASANVSGLVSPTNIGFALIPSNNLGEAQYSYTTSYEGPEGKLEANYNNVPQPDFTLYPMVKYKGIDVIAEPYLKFESPLCPDENHPHMIDLGLPSGTKWACCNIGASTPYEGGGRYAWGETEEKSSYSVTNYAFAQASPNGRVVIDGVSYNFIYIGENICGTKYDVSNVKWGNTWRMPSVEEMEELVNQCTWQLGEDRYSYIVTGSNGSAILLPRLLPGNPALVIDYWTGCLDHEASFRRDIYCPIPYVLWYDPAPHVHSPTIYPDWVGYYTAPQEGCYVRAVSDSNIATTRMMNSQPKTPTIPSKNDSAKYKIIVESENVESSQKEVKTYVRSAQISE